MRSGSAARLLDARAKESHGSERKSEQRTEEKHILVSQKSRLSDERLVGVAERFLRGDRGRGAEGLDCPRQLRQGVLKVRIGVRGVVTEIGHVGLCARGHHRRAYRNAYRSEHV